MLGRMRISNGSSKAKTWVLFLATGLNPLPFITLSFGEACSTEQVLLTLMGEDYAKGLILCPNLAQ